MDDRRIRRRERTADLGAAGVSLGVAGVGCGLTVLVSAAALALVASVLMNGCEIDVGRDPGDGKRSERVTVTVSPRTGLRDGDTVTVSSMAFGPTTLVGVAVCLREADTESRGVDACDTNSGARFATTADGTLSATLPIPRQIRVGDRVVDCADPDTPCLVVAADSNEYDRSGGEAISFRTDLGPAAGSPPAARPNTLLLPISGTPASPVAAGTAIEVVAMGFQPGEPLVVAHCRDFPETEALYACDPRSSVDATFAVAGAVPTDPEAVAAADGTYRTTVEARATVTPYFGGDEPKDEVNCSTEADGCSILIAAAADLARSAVLPYRVLPD